MSVDTELEDRILQKIEALLVRERLFREDFTHRVKDETVAMIGKRSGGSFCNYVPVTFGQQSSIAIHTTDGHRLILDMREKFMALHLLEHREWEGHIRNVMAKILVPGGFYVDVGANIGVHCLYAHALIGATGKIVALEPHPVTRAICRENLEINGMLDDVVLLEFAASDRDQEQVSFEYFPEHPAMSGFQISKERLDKFHGSVETIQTTTTTVDALLQAEPRAADLIKIDVEGFELTVLNGCKQTLAQSRDTCYLIEYGKELAISVMGRDPIAEIHALFHAYGYVAAKVHNDLRLTRVSLEMLLQDAGGDFLFVHPDSKHFAGLPLG